MKITITETKQEYSRTESGRGWKSKPETTETKTITEEQHKNATSAETCRFFRRLGGSETVTRSYTPIGYVPVEVISCSPDRRRRIVRKYDITAA